VRFVTGVRKKEINAVGRGLRNRVG
jgi:hypothetical protein